MYALKEKNTQKTTKKSIIKRTSKDCAYIAVFVALLIAAQLCFAFIPGVEIVTVLFITYSFTFGVKRGVLAAVAFSLVRQLVFGFFPKVLVLYLLYYPVLGLLFGWLGRKVKSPVRALWWLTLTACACSVFFTMIDNIITPLWDAYTKEAARAYFFASLPVMLSQGICTAATVAFLFLPLERVFRLVKF